MQSQGLDPVSAPTGENFFRPVAGAADEGLGSRLFNHPSRAACTVLSIGYFGFLWLTDGGKGLPFAMGFLYVFLTLPRWKDLGLGNVFFIAAIPQFFYILFETLNGPFGLPLLAHFAVVAPAVFLSIAPLGVTLPQFSGKTGRAAFILLALPFFAVLGSQYWPDLDRVLSLLWSMLWSPIEKVTDDAVVAVGVFTWLQAWGRAADIGVNVSKRGGYVLAAMLALFYFLRISDSLMDYTPAMDLILATGVFTLCIWPGRPGPDQKAAG
jgi:hypothetical protein